MRTDILAQANQAPSNGASNASDFQPPTRNPQNEGINTQEQSTGVQQTGDQDVLNNSQAQIEVPINPADHDTVPNASTGGINWFAVILASVVLVVAAESLLRKLERRRRQQVVAPTHEIQLEPLIEPIDTPEDTVTRAPEEPGLSQATEASVSKGPTPAKKKKSKSKRKKK